MKELDGSDEQRQDKSADEDVEDSGDVRQFERTRSFLLQKWQPERTDKYAEKNLTIKPSAVLSL